MTAGPITKKAVAEKAVIMRKTKKAAMLGARAVAMEQRRNAPPVVMQHFLINYFVSTLLCFREPRILPFFDQRLDTRDPKNKGSKP